MRGLVLPEIEVDRVRAQWEHVNEIHQSLWLSKLAIVHLVGHASGVKAALDYRKDFPKDGVVLADLEEQLKGAEKVSALARAEVDNDFPILHGQTVVSLWGMFEALIEDFLLDWMERVPGALDKPAIGKLKMVLSQFIQKDKREQCALILHELQRATGADVGAGVTVAEKVLDSFGLVPITSPELRRDIYELQKVRNVIVHRGSLADAMFARSCPWIDVPVGARIQINSGDYFRFAEGVTAYIKAVFRKADDVDNRWRRPKA